MSDNIFVKLINDAIEFIGMIIGMIILGTVLIFAISFIDYNYLHILGQPEIKVPKSASVEKTVGSPANEENNEMMDEE